MFKKILVFALLLVPSSGVLSATYNGYTSSGSTVRGAGLEWMRWDETVGVSVSAALNANSAAGWRMATQSEMAALFNAFDFGSENIGEDNDFLFDDDENTSQTATFLWEASETSSAHKFIELFGDTLGSSSGTQDDPFVQSRAYFGGFGECCSLARVQDDWTSLNASPRNRTGRADMGFDTYNGGSTSATAGVALVKFSPVPIPAAAWLFGSAMVGLAGIKRKK